jgi:hypothetical protein
MGTRRYASQATRIAAAATAAVAHAGSGLAKIIF